MAAVSRKPLRGSKPVPGVATPQEAARRRLRLVSDGRQVVTERRRWDCERLATCEHEWILVHGGAQAKCPTVCIRYQRREADAVNGDGVGGVVSFSEG